MDSARPFLTVRITGPFANLVPRTRTEHP